MDSTSVCQAETAWGLAMAEWESMGGEGGYGGMGGPGGMRHGHGDG
jgi:hypothetical protein